MKIRKIILLSFLALSVSCGVCFPTNLDFTNIKYFNKSDFKDLDFNATYRESANYEATRDLKVINKQNITKRDLKFRTDGFVSADLWNWNDKKQQGIIYLKDGNRFIDNIGSTQDRCRFIQTFNVKIQGEKLILIKRGGINNLKEVYEFTKVTNQLN